jgi:hypothetical protein
MAFHGRRRAADNGLRLVVMGTLAANPWAGPAWQQMQLAAGLRRLGHDVHYIEATSVWPYDPVRKMKVDDSVYAAPYLARVAESFGLGERWAYRRSYSDKRWLGPSGRRADELLATADAVFNVAGATRARTEEGLTVGRLVFFGTDPPSDELGWVNGDRSVERMVDRHDDFVTIGENIGTTACPVPPLPRLRSRTRQPVLVDLWRSGPPSRREFTTVCNWKQRGRDTEFAGERYLWSKHHEFLKFIDLPTRTERPIELAMGLQDADSVKPALGDPVPALGMTQAERRLLHVNGWQLADAHAFTTDVWSYRDYVEASSGEFSVAKDQNVRLRTGWFSERSACYLAAGRPVIVQDTGFGTVLPVGEGLFAFNTTDEALAAFEAIESDYGHHSRAAREIAEEYFRAEKVLAQMLDDLGL